jgi:hypothetical protein
MYRICFSFSDRSISRGWNVGMPRGPRKQNSKNGLSPKYSKALQKKSRRRFLQSEFGKRLTPTSKLYVAFCPVDLPLTTVLASNCWGSSTILEFWGIRESHQAVNYFLNKKARDIEVLDRSPNTRDTNLFVCSKELAQPSADHLSD